MQKVCDYCGQLFSCPDYRFKFCSAECKQANRRIRRAKKYADRKRILQSVKRKIGSVDHCVGCGNPYIVNSAAQKYCKDCAKKYRRSSPSKQREYRMRWKEKDIEHYKKIIKLQNANYYLKHKK